MSQIPPPPLPAPDLSKPMVEQHVEKTPEKSQIMNALVNTHTFMLIYDFFNVATI